MNNKLYILDNSLIHKRKSISIDISNEKLKSIPRNKIKIDTSTFFKIAISKMTKIKSIPNLKPKPSVKRVKAINNFNGFLSKPLKTLKAYFVKQPF